MIGRSLLLTTWWLEQMVFLSRLRRDSIRERPPKEHAESQRKTGTLEPRVTLRASRRLAHAVARRFQVLREVVTLMGTLFLT